jgi:hypothetical protein
MEKKMTPYTTKTGLKIGEFYEKKRYHEMNFDMELIQSAYLDDNSMYRSQLIGKIKYAAFVIGVVLLLTLVTKN